MMTHLIDNNQEEWVDVSYVDLEKGQNLIIEITLPKSFENLLDNGEIIVIQTRDKNMIWYEFKRAE